MQDINKEIASVCAKAAINLIDSLNLSPTQLDSLYSDLEIELRRRNSA